MAIFNGYVNLPSGYVKIAMDRSTILLMGDSTISMVIFHSFFDITRGYVEPKKSAENLQQNSTSVFCFLNPAFCLAKPHAVPFSWHFWGGSVGRHPWETLQIKNGLDLVLSAEPDILSKMGLSKMEYSGI